ncbi:MAG TPA: 5-(carboxyamino)imidazole ribonucleotide synthase [Tepidisphaeraceae bacterium]|jgi:5-(carboxyamino)imidazole ribonucleotide synthase|nr:5-(carboxyamino)imidazole ribonucleotide synthase [Tepidisphaeraceae bacterium]
MTHPSPILPGSTIGVLGSGQLGRMFTIAARQMGYRVHTFSPDSDTPTGQVADLEVTASYDDLDAVRAFARDVSVVTFEFENVPAPTAAACAECGPVRPGGNVLHTTQHRLREKAFLSQNGFPVTPYRAVHSIEDVRTASREIGPKGVIKTAAFGYDGKGQSKVATLADAEAAIAADPQVERVFEALVDFDREVSVVAARGVDGAFAHWGVIENVHRNHILDVSIAHADLPPVVMAEAVEIARGIFEALQIVGVLCVEFFYTKSGKLLVNELAPRPHNSGHLTIDACVTSQFEQQLRAVCGLPLGATTYHRAAAMAQLLGDEWQHGEPAWDRAIAMPDVKLHLYGKRDAKPGRKMGHLTALADTPDAARELVLKARSSIARTNARP